MAKREQRIAIRRVTSSYLSSIISTALVLFLVGVGAILLLNARRLSLFFQENVSIAIILSENSTEADAAYVRKQMDVAPFARETNYISKEQAAEEMKEMLGAEFMDAFSYNPLPYSIEIKLKAEYSSSDSVDVIEKQLQSMDFVREVTYQKSLIELVNENINKIGAVMLVFVVLLFFIALFLINNTIRLSVYAKRFIIDTMRLVGATHSFISRPFLMRSLLQGLISGTIAVLLLISVLYLLQNEFGEMLELINITLLSALFIGVLALGMLISFISTYFAVRRYVRLDTGALYY